MEAQKAHDRLIAGSQRSVIQYKGRQITVTAGGCLVDGIYYETIEQVQKGIDYENIDRKN